MEAILQIYITIEEKVRVNHAPMLMHVRSLNTS